MKVRKITSLSFSLAKSINMNTKFAFNLNLENPYYTFKCESIMPNFTNLIQFIFEKSIDLIGRK